MTTDAQDPFQQERQRLIALAYRMLGERAAAEDVVQDVWLRWSGAAHQDIENPAAWLHRVTTRAAIDALRSARNRRETYIGPWLPEPLVAETDQSGEDRFAMAQECHLALLWAMERLTPEERAAFILRQVFDTEYSELADILNKSEAACRQLVSRAARQVKSQKPRFVPDPAETAALLGKFAQATLAQDHATVLSLLAPDVVAISDGGGKVSSAFRPLVGPQEVAQVILSIVSKKAGIKGLKLIRANHAPALAILEGGPDDMIYTITSNEDGLINWIYSMRNPDKLPLH